MKKTLKVLALVSMVYSYSAFADPNFRPYTSCVSSNESTRIEVYQNVDPSNRDRAYKFDISRTFRGNSVSMNDKYAFRVPVQRKDVMEFFQSNSVRNQYFFELVVTKETSPTMIGTFKSYFVDILGRTVVYCSHHITFNP